MEKQIERIAADRKVFLLGIDGLPPAPFRRFLAEGRMPHFARLLEHARSFDVIPTLPATTAPGWLSIASGAYPSVVGVENILLPTPGQALDTVRNGFAGEWSKAEYIWETLDRHELPSIVMKYPGSWPPRPGKFIQVDGAGGYADITCEFEVVSSQAYVSAESISVEDTSTSLFPTGYKEHWRIDTGQAQGREQCIVRQPLGWIGLDAGAQPAFEFIIHMQERGKQQQHILQALAFDDGLQSLLFLSVSKHITEDTIVLRCGEWSSWIYQEHTAGAYAYRFKLLALDLEQRRFHLYRSEGHRVTGFTQPQTLAAELHTAVGPVVEWTGTYDVMNELIDLDTQYEIYQQHTQWLIHTMQYLCTTQAWNGFFMHWHVLEYAHHLVGASLHPEHPLHNPAYLARDLDFLGKVYTLADQLLEAAEAVINEQTLLVIGSDHGHDLVHTIFYINHFLQRHGWLVTRQKQGRQVIDWTHSVAYALFPGFILLNHVDQHPQGIVQEHEVAALIQEITQALKSTIDVRTGQHPLKVILTREELLAFGQSGAQAPDLFFCMERGYEPATRLGADTDVEFEVTIPYKEVTSGHGSFFPLSPSARTMAILSGPPDYVLPQCDYPISVMDLAPTMTAFLGIPAPKDCQGHAVHQHTVPV